MQLGLAAGLGARSVKNTSTHVPCGANRRDSFVSFVVRAKKSSYHTFARAKTVVAAAVPEISDGGEEIGASNGNGAGGTGNKQPPKRQRALPLSMFKPFGSKLPTDGRTQTEEEEFCDPYERNCQTPIYVWENKCEVCSGLGQVRSRSARSGRGRGNRALFSSTYYTCMACNGLGYVRRTSSRFMPELNGGSGPDFTLGRLPSDDEGEDGPDPPNNSRNGTGPRRR